MDTVANATVFSFNEQAAILATSFSVSVLFILVFASLVFGLFGSVSCKCCDFGGAGMFSIDEDGCCCLAAKYFCYRWCPCFCRDCRKEWAKSVAELERKLREEEEEKEKLETAAEAAEENTKTK